MARVSPRQAVEVCLAWTLLLYRGFAADLLLLDWLAVFAAYWIFCAFGQHTRAWVPVTAAAAVWLAAIHLRAHLPHALALWGLGS